MDNDNFSFLADAESSITGDKTEGYTPKEQELIHQLVQERLARKMPSSLNLSMTMLFRPKCSSP